MLLETITDLNAVQVSALSEWQVSSVADLAWTPDSSLLAIATNDRIEMYDPLTRENLRTLYPQTEGLVNIEFGPGFPASWLLAGTRRGSEAQGFASALELWRGPDWQPFGILLGIPRGLIDLAYSPDGKRVATAYGSPVEDENLIELIDPISWTVSANLTPGIVQNIAFSPNGKFFAASPDRYNVRIWDLEKGVLAYKFFTSFTGSINSMQFSPDGNLLAVGNYDGIVQLYDVNSGVLVREIPVGAAVESLAFSPDGRLLASGSGFQDNSIRLWSVTTGELLNTLKGHPQAVTSLLFSPDGKLLVSGSFGGLVRLWGIRPEQ